MTKDDVLKKKVGFISLGCDKNRVDLEKIIANIRSAGFEITADESEANIILINTCAFLQASREEAVSEMASLKNLRQGNLEKVIVTGCLTRYRALYKEELAEYADCVVLNNQNADIVKIIYSLYGVDAKYCFDDFARVLTTPSHIAYLKIAEGCNNKCAFCAIPNIKGKYVSRPIEDIVKEAKSLVKMGVKEIALVAQDVTNYGFDLYKKRELITLCKELEKIKGLEWIRLHYCYPELVTDELISYIKNSQKVVKYIDVPLQHIDNDILARMNRKNSEEQTYKVVHALKQAGISIRSTFIVGFPGETREEFNKLLKFLKKEKLQNVGFFAYSNEVGTMAYTMQNQISENIKNKRLAKVQKVQEKIYKKLQKQKIGTVCDAIIDEVVDDNVYIGRTSDNSYSVDSIITLVALNKLQPGQIIKARITGSDGIDLIGEEEK